MRIIAGMHRSGTSLVARLCLEAGADMGDTEAFYRPDKWNPDGYFEHVDIHAINMPLINGPWGKLAYFFPPSEATIVRRADKRAGQIEAAARKYNTTLVKENRFCLTLPAWLAHGAQVEGIVFCLREPLSVAQSLRKRNKISLRRGLELWRIHNARLLEYSRPFPTWFVSYEHLLSADSTDSEVAGILRFLKLDISDDRRHRITSEVIKPSMNHAEYTQHGYPSPMASLWTELQQRHEAQFA